MINPARFIVIEIPESSPVANAMGGRPGAARSIIVAITRENSPTMMNRWLNARGGTLLFLKSMIGFTFMLIWVLVSHGMRENGGLKGFLTRFPSKP